MSKLKLALAYLYRFAYKLHHGLFLRKGSILQHANLVIVGSFRVGGAGKTPFCAWLAKFLHTQKSDAKIAILCHSCAYDEAILLKKQLTFATVLKTKNRYRTARRIDQDFDYIICDDGFEDSRFAGASTIRLDWETPPKKIGDLVPAGKNRSLPCDHEAPSAIFTCQSGLARKVPEPRKDEESSEPDIAFGIDNIENSLGKDIREMNLHANPYIICGLGDGERFASDVQALGIQATKTIFRKDHDKNFEKALRLPLKKGFPVIVSEKDLVRVSGATQESPLLFKTHQTLEVSKKTEQTLERLFFY